MAPLKALLACCISIATVNGFIVSPIHIQPGLCSRACVRSVRGHHQGQHASAHQVCSTSRLGMSSLLPPEVMDSITATYSSVEQKELQEITTSAELDDTAAALDTELSLSVESSPEKNEEGEPSPADQPALYLTWLNSREAEIKVINRFVNVGFLGLVVALALSKILGNALVDSRGWTPEEIAMRLPLQNWNAYIETLQRTPIQVKAITSCSVYAIGDIVAQITALSADGDGPEIEIADVARRRVLISAAAGLIGHGPLSHFWYQISEGLFDMTGWNSNWWVFLPKVAVDQLVWGPIWNGTYILLLGLMNREAISKIIKDVRETSIPLLLSGLKLWPLAHCVTYGLIPVENRLLWVDAVEILWVTILSKQAASQHSPAHAGASGGHVAAAVKEKGVGGSDDDNDEGDDNGDSTGGGGGGGATLVDGELAALASVAAAAASIAANLQ